MGSIFLTFRQSNEGNYCFANYYEEYDDRNNEEYKGVPPGNQLIGQQVTFARLANVHPFRLL